MNASSEESQLWEFGHWPAISLIIPSVLGVLAIYFWNSTSRTKVTAPAQSQKEKHGISTLSHPMGDIAPLSNLSWTTEEPRKIYKFNPKYFLTMGNSIPSSQNSLILTDSRSPKHNYKLHNAPRQTIRQPPPRAARGPLHTPKRTKVSPFRHSNGKRTIYLPHNRLPTPTLPNDLHSYLFLSRQPSDTTHSTAYSPLRSDRSPQNTDSEHRRRFLNVTPSRRR